LTTPLDGGADIVDCERRMTGLEISPWVQHPTDLRAPLRGDVSTGLRLVNYLDRRIDRQLRAAR
jgi:hypothetical protein